VFLFADSAWRVTDRCNAWTGKMKITGAYACCAASLVLRLFSRTLSHFSRLTARHSRPTGTVSWELEQITYYNIQYTVESNKNSLFMLV